MIGKKVKLKKNAVINEVLDLLAERKKRKEFTYEQQRAYDHAKLLTQKKRHYDKVKKELDALGILSEDAIIKILELSPKSKELLSQVLIKEKRVFSDEDKEKILSIIGKS